MKTKIAAISVVRNECDIIELFIKINSRVVDSIFIIDHMSCDKTPEIIALLSGMGYPIKYHRFNSVYFNQSRVITKLVNDVAHSNEFDYIIPLDADEFLPANLRESISSSLSLDEYGLIPWRTFAPNPGSYFDAKAPLYELFRARNFEPKQYYKIAIGNALAKACEVKPGNHSIVSPTFLLKPKVMPFFVDHAPIRSVVQFQNKVIRGSHSIRLNPNRLPTEGFHWDFMAQFIRAKEFSIDYEDVLKFSLCYASRDESSSVCPSLNQEGPRIGLSSDEIEFKTLAMNDKSTYFGVNTLKQYDRLMLKINKVGGLENLDELTEVANILKPNAIVNSKNCDDYLGAARSLINEGNLQGAHDLLMCRMDPSDFHVFVLLAKVMRDKGKREQALHYCLRAFELQPDHPTLAAEIATDLRALGRLDEAEQVLLALQERLPKSTHALSGLAQIARKRGDHEKALAYHQAFEAIQPDHPTISIEVATDLRALGRLDEAEQALDRNSNPSEGLICHHRGLNAISRGEIGEAISLFERGIFLQPSHHVCHHSLVSRLLQERDYKEAQVALEKALVLFPELIGFPLLKIRLLKITGKILEAIEFTEKLLAKSPEDAKVIIQLIDLYTTAGQLDKAMALIGSHGRFLAQDEIHFRKSQILRAEMNIEPALLEVGCAVAISPHNAEYLQQQFYLLITQGDISNADICLGQLIEIYTNKGLSRKKQKSVGGFARRLFKEIKLNPFAISAMKGLQNLPLSEKITATAKAFDDEPNHLGLAISLLLSCATFDKKISNQTPLRNISAPKIPRIIVQFWNEKELSDQVKEAVSSWQKMNPDFAHQIYDDQSAAEFIEQFHAPDILKAFRIANHPAMRSDLFRLAYLYEHGGVYADADDYCYRSIEGLIGSGEDLVLIHEPIGAIANNFVAVTPKHPFIKAALDKAAKNILEKSGEIWFVSGPGSLTLSFCQLYLSHLRQNQLLPKIALRKWSDYIQNVQSHLSLK